ncbi:hypothetical protein PJL18_04036 [Paenarthrobacter nicotinovorans]|nr:hypothetical protein [Paenarthrobacter nicotinovorans]
MVLVPLHGAFHAVHVRLTPGGVVTGVAHPAVPFETVGLEVAFQDHPETQFVRDVQQAGVRRVVAGADRVDVELFHHGQVRAGKVLVEHTAAVRMRLMPVHAVEHHAPAVHQEPVAPDLHGPEAQPQRNGLAFAGHRRVVEARNLRGPRLDGGNRHRGDVGSGVPDDVDVQFGDGQANRVGGLTGRDLRVNDPGAGGEGRPQPDVVETLPWPGLYCHVAKDAGHPPLVLVLDVA